MRNARRKKPRSVCGSEPPPCRESGGPEWQLAGSGGSAEFLGEADEKSLGPPDVADPVHVFVLNHFVNELCTVFAKPGERIVDVVDGEHDPQVAKSVLGSLPVVSGHRRSDESRKLESALAVRRTHHGDLDM